MRYDASVLLPSLMRFKFLDPGVLRDGELQLVPPAARDLEDVLISEDPPIDGLMTDADAARRRQLAFLDQVPGGRERAGFFGGRAPAYHFWMRLHSTPARSNPPVPIAGGLNLRIGDSRDLRCYVGHVGYMVYRRARGYHFAERAVRLLLPLARRHGMGELWITTNPDNWPSRRTCERLGAELVEVVELPRTHDLYKRGEREKCRYRLAL